MKSWSTLTAWRRRRIGLELARSPRGDILMKAVGLRGQQVEWYRERSAEPTEKIDDTLSTFLVTLPRTVRWHRPRIGVALGPTFVQLKHLPGLPPLADAKVLTSAVRQGAGRFFMKNGVPLALSKLRIDGAGEAWGGAMEQPLLTAIERACHTARLQLTVIAPTATVLSPARNAATVEWLDGSDGYTFEFSHQNLVRIAHKRRQSVPRDDDGSSQSSRFAAATGIARRWTREPIAWSPSRQESEQVNARHRLLAWATLAIAVVAVAITPGIANERATRRASAHLRVVASQRSRALAVADSVHAESTAFGEIADFANHRRSATATLGDLTRAIPAPSAILALTIDSVSGTMVVLTPDAGALMTHLTQDRGFASVELVGPVTHEAMPVSPRIGTTATIRKLDRASVRFRFAAP